MPEFISKLQHKYYEKGEYAEEEIRTLEDTLQLIKDFPWDRERGVDVQLTCPSVVIQDENTNYLKIAIYYNGKYCLYYFDCNHHLYEFHTPDLSDVYEMVTGFFDKQIDLQKFEKHTLSIGAHKHFESANFDNTISESKFYLQFFISALFLTFAIIITVSMSYSGADSHRDSFVFIFTFIWSLLPLYFIYCLIKVYNKSKGLYLNISRGNDIFKFGYGDSIRDYNKSDITKINIFGKPNSTSSLNIIEVNFNDGTQIKFPTMLIDAFTFASKFQDQTKYEYIINFPQNSIALWNY